MATVDVDRGASAPGERRPVLPAGPAWPQWEVRYLSRLLAADLLVGLGAGVLAFFARFGTTTEYDRGYLLLSTVLPVAFIAALAANRAYERRFLFVGPAEYERVLRAGFTLTAAIAVVAYALNIPLSRGYVAAALPLATLACLLNRYLQRHRLHRARARGECLRRVIVAGHAAAVAQLTAQLRRERYHGLDVVGGCLPSAEGGIGVIAGVHLPVYGGFDRIAEAVAAAGADTVVVLACPELDGVALRRLAWRLEGDAVDLIVASSLLDVAGDRTTIRPVDGLPMLHVEHPTLGGARRVVKAVFDRVVAAALLGLLAPALLVIAAAIRLDSPGPVLFRQTRVGKDGRTFTMLKFRSMCPDAPQRQASLRRRNDGDGVLFKLRQDPRLTRVGPRLRRYSLDELPQLVNVVVGDMSLVGPRPPLPEEVAVYPEDLRRRLLVKPGMTGLWQVSGRSDLPWEEAARLDLRYVENWTLSLDLIILLRTVGAVTRCSGAY